MMVTVSGGFEGAPIIDHEATVGPVSVLRRFGNGWEADSFPVEAANAFASTRSRSEDERVSSRRQRRGALRSHCRWTLARSKFSRPSFNISPVVRPRDSVELARTSTLICNFSI